MLHALRREIGDDAFFTLLQRWVAENDGTSRTTEDFIAARRRGRRPGPDGVLRDWLYAEQVPAVYPG